jgi:hypothetical protein
LKNLKRFKSQLLEWYEDGTGFPEMLNLFKEKFGLDTNFHSIETSIIHWTAPRWWQKISHHCLISFPIPNLPVDLLSSSELEILENGIKAP